MQKNVVDIDIIAVLDRSGSMAAQMGESISQFNEYVKGQIEDGITGTISLYTFDSTVEKVLERVEITQFVDLDPEDLRVRGLTALNDGIGQAMTYSKAHGNNLFIIMTDGGENCSKKFNTGQIKEMVKEAEGRGDSFVFFGAGVDAFSVGGNYGMNQNAYVNIDKSASGMRSRGVAMKSATTSFYASKNNSDISSVHGFDD